MRRRKRETANAALLDLARDLGLTKFVANLARLLQRLRPTS